MRKTLRVSVSGRSDTAPAEDTSAAPVAEGKASGTITIWAMGTEGRRSATSRRRSPTPTRTPRSR